MAIKHSPRLIIFDVGNVLIRHDNELLVERLCGYCTDRIGARMTLVSVMSTRFLSERDGRVAALYGRLQEHGLLLTEPEFETVFCSHFSLEQGMDEVVGSLAAGQRVVVLSNTNRVHWKHWLEKYSVLRIPHARYASYELGIAKPDPGCYRRVLAAEGYAPKAALFIDDKPENTAAAARLGMAVITYQNRAALIEALSLHFDEI